MHALLTSMGALAQFLPRAARGLAMAVSGGALALTLGQGMAWGQPTQGTSFRNSLPMGSGASVPLPQGQWRVTYTNSHRFPNGMGWDNVVLQNEEPSGIVRFLVVSQSQETGRWGNTGCQTDSSTHFMVNDHDTKPNHLVNKCSRVFGHNNIEEWKQVQLWNAPQHIKDWWSGVMPGLADMGRVGPRSLLQVELRVQQYNHRLVQVGAFVLPPQGVMPTVFRNDHRNGVRKPEHELLAGWNAIYIEALQQSYFNKKPQQLMALSYAVDGPNPLAQAGTAAPQQVAAGPASSAPAASVQRPAAAPAPSVPVAVAAPVPVPVPTAPSATAAAAAAAAAALAADNAERLRLDKERKAAEEDKRKMAEQLAAMSQMLARLQQENTAAAEAKVREAAAAEATRAREAEAAAAKLAALPQMAHRKALVIGNDLYTDVPRLNNAGADAEAMARSLTEVGYKVFKHLNLNEKGFRQAVRDFKQQVNGGDEVLVFYAGHGVQLGNANYLLPVDIRGDSEDQVRDEAIQLQRILDDLEDKKTKFALAVIDACRDNPFRSKGRALGGRGLAPTTAATGQMIMFSAGSGQQALDRLGDKDPERNGLFTRIFVREMQKPGLPVDRVLRNVRNEVVRLARTVGHDQTPALYDQSIGEFFFRP